MLLLAACQRKQNATQLPLQPTPLFDSLLNRATRHADSGKSEIALRYADSVYAVYEDKVTTVDRYFYYNFYYYLLNKLGYSSRALPYADSMLQIAGNGGIMRGKMEAEGYYAKADAFFSLHQYEDAYYHMYKAKQLVRENLDSCGISDYNYRLGMVLYKQKRFADACQEFKEALTQSSACADNFLYYYRRQELLDNIGLCYQHQNKPDSALIFYNQGIALLEGGEEKYPYKSKSVFHTARGVFFGNMADAYRDLGMTDTAEALYNRSIYINNTVYNDVIDAQYTRLKLVWLYLNRKHDMVAAKGMLDEIGKTLRVLNNDVIRSQYYDMLWRYYEADNQPTLAFEYLKKHHQLTDSISSRNKIFTETDISERFKNMDKQYTVNILEQSKIQNETYLLLSAVGGFMLLIILALIFLNWYRARKHVKTLTTFNHHIKQQRDQQDVLLQQLRQAGNEKDRILRVVAHDVRNPIAAIMALTEFMNTDSENLTAEQKEYMGLIHEACTNALALTKEILEATNTGRADALHLSEVDINNLLNNSISLLRFKAAEKSQALDLQLLPETLLLTIDKEKIWRVINNLVVNAIKFSNNGSTITIKAARQKHELIISIADEGIGIPQAYADKIFDMFTDAKRPGTLGEPSYGLGLSICRKIMEDHKGRIYFTSRENEGTTFYISLPVAK
jgi:Signal transduction histidine kinase